jgi:hypothetical protein
MMTEKKTTPFRNWLRKMWVEHCDEVEAWTGSPCNYDMAVYFLRYKWWLKAVYKREVNRAGNC